MSYRQDIPVVRNALMRSMSGFSEENDLYTVEHYDKGMEAMDRLQKYVEDLTGAVKKYLVPEDKNKEYSFKELMAQEKVILEIIAEPLPVIEHGLYPIEKKPKPHTPENLKDLTEAFREAFSG